MIQDLLPTRLAVTAVKRIDSTTPVPSRLASVDMLRGVAIVLMTLDHVRDFLSSNQADPMDLTQTSAALFLTRWITHFCAPVFVFLAGTGAYFYGIRLASSDEGREARLWSKKNLARFLVTRGLWLVFLELTLVRFGWTFNLHFGFQAVGVIWAIGWSMVVLAGLIFLPLSAIAVFAIAVIAFHNLFDGVLAGSWGPFGWLWAILHSGETVGWQIFRGWHPVDWEILATPEMVEGFNGFVFGPGYPLIPWVAIMASGFCLGALLPLTPNPSLQRGEGRNTDLPLPSGERAGVRKPEELEAHTEPREGSPRTPDPSPQRGEGSNLHGAPSPQSNFDLTLPSGERVAVRGPDSRRQELLGLGSAIIVLFILLRATNVYGDRHPWTDQKSLPMTLFSFLNCHKYPPSLLYVLMTLGPAIVLLGLFTNRNPGWLGRFLMVFGRVPLFFYFLHLYVIHGLTLWLANRQHPDAPLPAAFFNFPPGHAPAGYGYDLPQIYLLWLFVVLLLFPPCYWFAQFKSRHRYAWLSYF
jgi:uncharacterized membrane protein